MGFNPAHTAEICSSFACDFINYVKVRGELSNQLCRLLGQYTGCIKKAFTVGKFSLNRGRGRSIIGGAHIHIFVCTDCKNNRFQKKLMMHNTNI